LILKILLIIKNFDLGGTEVHVRELANGLSRIGHKVFVISRLGRQIENLDEGVVHRVSKMQDWKYFLNVKEFSEYAKVNQIDVIHGHQRMGISLAAQIASKLKIPSIATVHGQFKLDLRSRFVKSALNRIIVVSPSRLDGVNLETGLMDKLKVIYNSVALPACDINGKSVSECFMVSYVSRIDKKHYLVLESLISKILPKLSKDGLNVRLKVVGEGSRFSKLENLVNNIVDDELRERVELMGYQKRPIIQMRSSDLVLGVGRVAIEALSSGVPVIPVNAAHRGEVITMENYERLKRNNFVARYTHGFSVDLLLERMRDFFENTPMAQDSKLESTVLSDFSQDTMISKVESVYREVV